MQACGAPGGGRKLKEMERFTATVTREGHLFVAQCREVDIASQGESEAEAIRNLREALTLHLENESDGEPEVRVSVA